MQASLQVLQELGEQLKQQVDTSAASAVQSDHLSLSQRLAGVEQALNRQLTALQVKKNKKIIIFMTDFCIDINCASAHERHIYVCLLCQTGVQDYETFNNQLESLGSSLVEAEDALRAQDPNGCTDLPVIQDRMEELKVSGCFLFTGQLDRTACEQNVKNPYLCFCFFFQRLMLKFSSMTPELEHLNELGYRLPLNDLEIKRMQNLNRSWSTASAQTTERFRCDMCIPKTVINNPENTGHGY